jgi:hypothetical protein
MDLEEQFFEDNNDDYTDGNGINIIDNNKKEFIYFIISRYKKVDHRLESKKEEELKLIKEKYDQDKIYLKKASETKIKEFEHAYAIKCENINDKYDKKMNEESFKNNPVIKLHLLHTKNGKPKKEYIIERGFEFKIHHSGKIRKCKVNGFHDYESQWSKQYDQLDVSFIFLNNNKPGRCNWDKLIPHSRNIF